MSSKTYNNEQENLTNEFTDAAWPPKEGCDCGECVGGCFRKLLEASSPMPQGTIDYLKELVGGVEIDMDEPLESQDDDQPDAVCNGACEFIEESME